MASDRSKILRAIQQESRRIRDPKARRVFRKAAVETGIVESGLKNLSYGDADSQGWRQERASLYKDPTNITASVKRFRQEFEQHYSPGEKSYQVAAQVQRPREDLRGRYKDVQGQASQILQGQPKESTPNNSQYTQTVGVDNSGQRQALKLSYLENRHDPGALLNLVSSLKDAADVPGTRTKIKAPAGKSSAPTAHGSYAGTTGAVIDLSKLAHSYGLTTTSGKRDTEMTASGNVSDHFKGSKNANARDLSGSPEQMNKAAKAIAKRLGIKGYKPGQIYNVNKGGIRYQLIYGTGDHLDHVHVGAKRL